MKDSVIIDELSHVSGKPIKEIIHTYELLFILILCTDGIFPKIGTTLLSFAKELLVFHTTI